MTIFKCDNDGKRMNYATLKRKLREAGRVAVQCPVCGAWDNDWPERGGLCCSCWCAAWCVIVDESRRRDGSTPPVEKVRKTIAKAMAGKATRILLSHKIMKRRGKRASEQRPQHNYVPR